MAKDSLKKDIDNFLKAIENYSTAVVIGCLALKEHDDPNVRDFAINIGIAGCNIGLTCHEIRDLIEGRAYVESKQRN